MPILEWKPEYAVRISEVDWQHKELVKMINELLVRLNKKFDPDSLRSVLTIMLNYSFSHFKTEEQLMQKFDYPYMQEHVDIHKKFIDKVIELFDKLYKVENRELAIEIANYLREWIIYHMANVDKKMANYLIKKGVK